MTVEDGAKGPVVLALLPSGGPSGCYLIRQKLQSFDLVALVITCYDLFFARPSYLNLATVDYCSSTVILFGIQEP
uniref:Uncharacterized protein n=1 Tax=Nelumbo nucifera TaxID=4432 RepID=A0A822ZHR3_NELNU|nr:TPA_asm: hypothetical protein HUJ06_001431 [Nelumbo nucifera]